MINFVNYSEVHCAVPTWLQLILRSISTMDINHNHDIQMMLRLGSREEPRLNKFVGVQLSHRKIKSVDVGCNFRKPSCLTSWKKPLEEILTFPSVAQSLE